MLERTNVLLRKACNEDGGWGRQAGEASDVTSTTYGLIAVCGQDDPGAAVDAADFLPAARREDGGISATSDSIGPRPFIFAVPSLAEVFTLLALGHLVTAPHSRPTGCRTAHDRQHGDGPVAVHWGATSTAGDRSVRCSSPIRTGVVELTNENRMGDR
ncbi:hypothetical protein ABT218_28245 [Streptomyces sp. NPDC001455]|uniref:hypothetical protein n=1 Tax=Streptomyces sp. NPDC001455 TaxID=3154518 RepID=UPI0033243714